MSASAIRSCHRVFVDWLTITHAPHEALSTEIVDVLGMSGFSRCEGSTWSEVQRFMYPSESPGPSASVRIEHRDRWSLVSLSGRAVSVLDSLGALTDFIASVMLEPSVRVSRLDLSLDEPRASVLAVRRRLLAIRKLGQSGKVRLGQKLVRSKQVRHYTTPRAIEDGKLTNTGTIYLGKRSNALCAAIYDKRGEMMERYGVDVGGEVIRYEMRIRKGIATLRDVVRPDPLFFRLASPDLLERPADVPEWEQLEMDPRLLPPVERLTPYDRLCRVIDNSSDLQLIRRMLEQQPNAAPLITKRINDALGLKSRDAA